MHVTGFLPSSTSLDLNYLISLMHSTHSILNPWSSLLQSTSTLLFTCITGLVIIWSFMSSIALKANAAPYHDCVPTCWAILLFVKSNAAVWKMFKPHHGCLVGWSSCLTAAILGWSVSMLAAAYVVHTSVVIVPAHLEQSIAGGTFRWSSIDAIESG